METKANPFFMLRERLYAAAAAGCTVIKEDFRLQRAIEAFQPLSAANPVFAKLYGMCQKLTESEQPALLLCECIALADAVAVTQSRFQDDTPASPAPGFAPLTFTQVSYQAYLEAKCIVEANTGHEEAISAVLPQAVHDPRLL